MSFVRDVCRVVFLSSGRYVFSYVCSVYVFTHACVIVLYVFVRRMCWPVRSFGVDVLLS